MNTLLRIGMVLGLSLNLYASSAIDRLHVITDHWPPYNILEGGELSGMSVELFELMLKKNKSHITREDFKVTSWEIVYDTVHHISNNVALTMTRNKIREKKFKWVGPLDVKQSGLIAKKSRKIKLKSMNDLSNYKIAVVKNYSTHQMLKKAGLKKNLFVTGGLFAVHKAIDSLAQDRVDMYSTSNIKYIMKIMDKKSFNPKDYEVVQKYKKDTMYFAFNRKIEDKVIIKMQKALDELKADGTYDRIRNKYLH